MKKNKYENKLISIEFARRLKDENIYLKDEMEVEKVRLKAVIEVLNKELEEVKEDNRKLNNEIENYQQIKEKIAHYSI
tara:strand:+ start:626 stop:859 length:234 start_codon:yes stop_codon:yes gene_type:complete